MPLRVILVQSETQAAQTLSRFFISRGDEVWSAWDLGQAQGLIEQVVPQLMLVDMHFPLTEWQAFLKRITRLYPDVRIVLTNKVPDLQREMWAREAGLNTFVRQPFSPRWLNQALEPPRTDAPKTGAHPAEHSPKSMADVRFPLSFRILLPAVGGVLLLLLVVLAFSAQIPGGWQTVGLPAAGAAVVITLVLVVYSLSVGRTATRSLQELVGAVKAVAEGNLEVKVSTSGRDETAVLSQAVNHMVAELQERFIFRAMLGREPTAQDRVQLREGFAGNALRLEGQEMQAVVLVCDIRGFTQQMEKVDALRTLEWLNDYVNRMSEVVEDHGGFINRIENDTLTAVFGLLPEPQPLSEACMGACQAGLAMLQTCNALNSERVRRGDAPFNLGVGIHCGPVIAGALGGSDRMVYAVVGDTVNTAQRLETLTRDVFAASGALISQTVLVELGDAAATFHTEPVGLRAVRGRAERAMVYRLQAAHLSPDMQIML